MDIKEEAIRREPGKEPVTRDSLFLFNGYFLFFSISAYSSRLGP